MTETTGTESPIARRLRLIQERMSGVPDEEVELALLMARIERTAGATTVVTMSSEPRRRNTSVLTQTV
jgi:hypothetical protein